MVDKLDKFIPRQEWLIKTLNILEGNFRETMPKEVRRKIGALYCMDARFDEMHDYKGTKNGEIYPLRHLAGALPRSEAADRDFKASVVLLTTMPTVEGMSITGHEDCKAVEAYCNHVLFPGDPHKDNPARFKDVYDFFDSVVSHDFKDALKQAYAGNASMYEIRKMVEKAIILQSLRNFYDYELGDKKVSDLVNEGTWWIPAAIRGLPVDNGKSPLEVFDPKANDFVPIEQLEKELYPVSNGMSTSARIIEDYKQLNKRQALAVKPAGSLVMKKVNKVINIAEPMMEELDHAIANALNNLTQMKGV